MVKNQICYRAKNGINCKLHKLDGWNLIFVRKFKYALLGSRFSEWILTRLRYIKLNVEERLFFIGILRDLLNLVEYKQGKENKATIASNIMYIVS